MRIRGTATLALLLVLGASASTASAEPLSMTFSEGRANVGVQLSDEALFGPPDTAPFAAQIELAGPANEEITAGVLEVPAFSTHITEPIDADVTVEFDIGEIEGNFAWAIGALTLKGEAGGTLTATNETYEGEECTVSVPEVLELSTATTASAEGAPRSGERFIQGLDGAGSIAGEWAHMDADPVDPEDPENVSFCKNVEKQIGGPGGVWLEQKDIVPPAPPLLSGADPAPPNLNGTPRILGVAEDGSTVRVYADPACAGAPIATGTAAELRTSGIFVAVAEGATVTLAATATDAAGNTSACSTPISYTRLRTTPPPPPPLACVVPNLVGKTLKAAKKKIRAANCKVGKVQRPKRPKGLKGRWVLVVKASNPAAGAKPANGKVHLKLGPKS